MTKCIAAIGVDSDNRLERRATLASVVTEIEDATGGVLLIALPTVAQLAADPRAVIHAAVNDDIGTPTIDDDLRTFTSQELRALASRLLEAADTIDGIPA